MTNDDKGEIAGGLDVQLAAKLIDKARAEGVSLVGPDGLLAGITKTVLQAALEAEMSEHLGYDKGERPARPTGNHHNGTSAKTVSTEVGSVRVEVPPGEHVPEEFREFCEVPASTSPTVICASPGPGRPPSPSPTGLEPVQRWIMFARCLLVCRGTAWQ